MALMSAYPTLKARAIVHAQLHRPHRILIEESGVGTALIKELQNAGLTAIAVKPERDKRTRMSIQTGKFESGQVFFPNRASWLEELEAELFAFPGSRHDDQVDSISQALAEEIQETSWDQKSLDGFAKYVEALTLDNYFGRVTGRPW